MIEEHKAKRQHSSVQDVFLFPASIRVRQPSSEEDRTRQSDFLLEQSAIQPDPTEARAHLKRVEAVIENGFNPAEARVAIALMIDAYPNARPHSPEAYIASIMDVLQGEGFPTAAVSIACHELKTETTFLPALAEVVEKVRSAAKSIAHQQNFLIRYLDWDERSTAALAWLNVINKASDQVSARATQTPAGLELVVEPLVRAGVARMGRDGTLAAASASAPKPILR